jgi:hypothetical protein
MQFFIMTMEARFAQLKVVIFYHEHGDFDEIQYIWVREDQW